MLKRVDFYSQNFWQSRSNEVTEVMKEAASPDAIARQKGRNSTDPLGEMAENTGEYVISQSHAT